MNQPELLRVASFAEATGTAEVTVRKWIRQGRIRSVLLGRARCIPAAELDRLVNEGLPPLEEEESPDDAALAVALVGK